MFKPKTACIYEFGHSHVLAVTKTTAGRYWWGATPPPDMGPLSIKRKYFPPSFPILLGQKLANNLDLRQFQLSFRDICMRTVTHLVTAVMA